MGQAAGLEGRLSRFNMIFILYCGCFVQYVCLLHDYYPPERVFVTERFFGWTQRLTIVGRTDRCIYHYLHLCSS